MNCKLTTGVRQLHPISVKAPWYMNGIDFIGPVSPEAEDGSNYIFIFVRIEIFIILIDHKKSYGIGDQNFQWGPLFWIKMVWGDQNKKLVLRTKISETKIPVTGLSI